MNDEGSRMMKLDEACLASCKKIRKRHFSLLDTYERAMTVT